MKYITVVGTAINLGGREGGREAIREETENQKEGLGEKRKSNYNVADRPLQS